MSERTPSIAVEGLPAADSAIASGPNGDFAAWIQRFEALGVRFRWDGDQLRCNAPAGVVGRPLLAEMARRKAEIAAYLDARSRLAAQARSAPREAPLSFAQLRIWFLQRMEPESAAYNLGTALRIDGELNEIAFESAVEQIVRRHEVLRTRIVERDGEAFQVVDPDARVELLREVLDAASGATRVAEVEQRVAEEFARPFDLTQCPLLRVRLLALGEREHVAIFTAHHIVADGWSTGILIREFATFYAAATRGVRPMLPPLSTQYADYAKEQRQAPPGTFDRALGFWTRKLAGASPLIDLGADRPRPPMPSSRGGVHRFQIDSDTADVLREVARNHDATLFMVLFTCFAIHLRAHAKTDDLPIGVPFANRRSKAIEPLIGFFVSTLVLRADLSDRPSFIEALRRVRVITLEAMEHQDLPFHQLVETLRPERNRAYAPLFQVMFNLLTIPRQLELPGLTIRPLESDECTAKLDLALQLEDAGSGTPLVARLEFSRDIFDSETVARMAARFLSCCREVAREPLRRLPDLPGLPASERTRLESWSVTPAPLPPKCLHVLFDEQVRRTPDAVAISWRDRQLSFSALQKQSFAIAARLREGRVQAESRVAVYLLRTPELAAVLLGVLRAGAAYVPLDFHHPPERRSHILRAAAVETVVTCRSLLPEIQSHLPSEVRILLVEDVLLSRSGEGEVLADRRSAGVHPDQLAYVLFTSGSTGLPKGVAITHANVSAFLEWARATFSLADRAAVLFGTSLCFDLSVFELFLPLSSGGRVVMVDNALALGDTPESSQLTLLNTVPSVAAELEQTGALPGSLRVINLAGEPLLQELVERIQTRLPQAAVHDLYGPSECTTYSTWARRVRGGPATIGRPVDGTTARVLDSDGQLAGIALSGELVLGGAGVARGYLGRADWTAEGFVPDAFSTARGARSYRTGDVARWRTDGMLEFFGRLDHQVKIRGLRIELGDIESALRGHVGVREACVVVAESAGERHLCGYVTAGPDVELDVGSLRSQLRASIPAYMVPSRIGILPSLPVNANGKVDRGALRRLAVTSLGSSEVSDASPLRGSDDMDDVPPRTATECAIAELWKEMLGVERVGIADDFFALGGHSLLAVRMLSKLRGKSGATVSLRSFFADPTVESLAREISSPEREDPTDAIVPLRGAETHPLSYEQERLWFLSRLEGGPRYVIPMAFEIAGTVDPALLVGALRKIVDRHEVLRCSFRIAGSVPVAVPRAVVFECQLDDLRSAPEPERAAELARARLAEAETRFDLTEAPLLRARLFQLEDRLHVLLLTAHHILCDGGSMEVLVAEMAALYRAFETGRPSPLAPLGIQYSDFARWQRARAPLGEEQHRRWAELLRDAPTELRLPYDRSPASSRPEYHGARAPWKLDARGASAVHALARREKTTPFTVILSAYAAWLERYTGQDDLVIGIPVGARPRKELDALIGFFVSLVPVRLRRFGGAFTDVVRDARSQVIDVLASSDVPFERIADGTTTSGRGRAGLLRTVFAFQGESKTYELAPGITLRPIESPDTEAKYDLTLSVQDEGGTLRGHFEYNADLFECSTADRMAADFATFLASSCADPDRPLGASDWRPLDESLREVELPSQPFRSPAFVHEVVREHARQRPDAIAAVFSGRQITYRALVRRAASWARALRARGVGPDDVVGVLAEPSIDMLVGLLGVLEAGGAYLPLDPNYPEKRLAYMMERARPRVVLVQREHALGGLAGDILLLDSPSSPDTPTGRTAPTSGPALHPGNIAYVIFTSGSSGRPKGIELTHEGLLNLARAQSRAFALSPGAPETAASRVLQFASLSFDASVSEIFATLFAGATLILEPTRGRMPGSGLCELIERESVTTITLPPSSLRVMPRERLDCLRTLIVAGEACPANVVREWLVPGRRFINAYGPSEVTVCASMGTLVAPDRPTCIGAPITGASMCVQDSLGRPVPAGVEGHLWVGGVGLARGYLHAPALTADRFRPDPRGRPGSRLYCTGDRARMLADGSFEFRGRADDQVKLRGYRIEPREIEARLAAHPSVQGAAVVLRDHPSGDQRLAAYVLPRDASDVPIEALWEDLRKNLPAFMVPFSLQLLTEWPVTRSGKLDRDRLPAPDVTPLGGAHAEPRDEWEREIAALFGDVLGRDAVGIHDDFFSLGGQSLSAVLLVETIRQRFGACSLAGFLEHPTVAEVAESLRAGGATDVEPVARLSAGPRENAWVLVPGADGMIVRFRELAEKLGGGRSIYAVQTPDREPLDSVEAMAEAYLGAIGRVLPAGPRCLLGFSVGGVVAFEIARRLRAKGKGPSTLVLLDSLAPAIMPKPEDELETFFSYAVGLGQAARATHLPPLDESTRQAWRRELVAVDPAEWLPRIIHLAEQRTSLSAAQVDGLGRRFRLFQSTSQAAARYRPGPYEGHTIVVRAASGAGLGAADPFLGWSAHLASAEKVESIQIDSDHESLFSAPHVSVLAEHLVARCDPSRRRDLLVRSGAAGGLTTEEMK